jgi:c-di-GMP-binding flagellar brake protein YcgR
MTRIFVQNRDGLIFALMGAIKMQTRYVRVLPTEVAVHVDDRAGYLTNLSLTGALVRMDTAIPVGLPVTFRLAGDRLAMTLNAAVRRNEQRDGAAGWWVALQFVNVSDREKRTIPRLIASAPFPSTAPHSHSLQARD